MSFCPKCGNQLKEGAKFCGSCGATIGAAAAAVAAPQQPVYQQPQPVYQAQPVPGQALYQVSEKDQTLRLVAFILNIISTVSVGWALIPLAWMIPTCVISWKIYKGTRANTTTFGVLTLIFTNIVSGILLLVSEKEA